MNYLKLAVLGVAFGSCGAIAADCTPPATPTLPDGASASMEDMLEGQKAVKAFQATNLEYMGCLDPHIKAATAKATGDSPTQEDVDAVKALEEQYNAAVSAEEELAGQFNTEIREYKAANPN
mgnify:CR=1 FL=1